MPGNQFRRRDLTHRYHQAPVIKPCERCEVELVEIAMEARINSDIEQIDPTMLGQATKAAEAALRQYEGPGGFDAPMTARFVTAIK